MRDVVTSPQRHLQHPDPVIRRLAVSCLDDPTSLFADLTRLCTDDPDEYVRAAAAERLAACGAPAIEPLLAATRDQAAVVAEAAATALGEVGDEGALGRLTELAETHADKLVREAAVAALGEIGAESSLATILGLLHSGPPQVRRRAVAAASAFIDGPRGSEVEAALTAALDDRNPMVREAAEMVVGRPYDGAPPPVWEAPPKGVEGVSGSPCGPRDPPIGSITA